MCESQICPCRYHKMKIDNEFVDIFEFNYTIEDEQRIEKEIVHNGDFQTKKDRRNPDE